jgi:[citrate (pro-3S)-lyase] ligase
LVADCLFDFLIEKKLIETKRKSGRKQLVEHPVLSDAQFMKQLTEYQEYLSQFKKEGKCGAICMNANPFTNGHLFLVETASKSVDHLFILVAEENRSIFTFEERWKLILEGTANFQNVTVIRGGIFVGSFITFPEYYDREVQKDIQLLPSLDLQVFLQHICPVLNITVRFIGTEPICSITNQYCNQLKAILPKNGVEVMEITRKETSEKVISASYVREIVKKWKSQGQKEEDVAFLRELVPPSTLAFLQGPFLQK